jgi:hypothetical protein
MRHGYTKSLVALCMALQLSACGGLDEGTAATTSLTPAPPSVTVSLTPPPSVTISWTPPVVRADAAVLDMAEIGGYRLYRGTTSGDYTDIDDIPDRTLQQFTVDLPSDAYFFVMTAYDMEGRESEFSSPEVALCTALELSACGGLETATPSVTASWTPPVVRANGDVLDITEISGYRLYRSTMLGGTYTEIVDIPDGTTQQVSVNLPSGTYYFVMTSYDTEGRESGFSPEMEVSL